MTPPSVGQRSGKVDRRLFRPSITVSSSCMFFFCRSICAVRFLFWAAATSSMLMSAPGPPLPLYDGSVDFTSGVAPIESRLLENSRSPLFWITARRSLVSSVWISLMSRSIFSLSSNKDWSFASCSDLWSRYSRYAALSIGV